jgi:hypothetical protein
MEVFCFSIWRRPPSLQPKKNGRRTPERTESRIEGMTFRLVAFALLGALALPASAGDSAEPERIIYFLGQYYRYTGSASDFPEIQERFARLEDASTRSTVREADWRVIQTQTQPLKGADVGNVQDFVRQAEESAQQGEKARSLLQRVRGGAAQLAGAARAAPGHFECGRGGAHGSDGGGDVGARRGPAGAFAPRRSKS